MNKLILILAGCMVSATTFAQNAPFRATAFVREWAFESDDADEALTLLGVNTNLYQPATLNLTNWAELATNVISSLPYQAPLPAGTDGEWLTLSGGLPDWAALPSSTNLPSLTVTNTAAFLSNVIVSTNLTVGGQVLVKDGTAAKPAHSFSDFPTDGIDHYGAGNIVEVILGGAKAAQFGFQFKLRSDKDFGWTSSTADSSFAAAPDVRLARDAANTLAQRNGTTAQTNRIYGTWTDGSNGEWTEVSYEGAGTATPYAVFAARENGTGGDNPGVKLLTKGTGAFVVDNPSTTAGNARGANAVDGQLARSAATEVASGNYSAVVGGFRNTASGQYSSVFGGYQNTASGEMAGVGGGFYNTASGGRSFVTGGQGNAAGGPYSRAGGYFSSSPRQGQDSFASGYFAERGDAQKSSLAAFRASNLNTQTNLTLGGGELSASTALAIPNNHTWTFTGTVTGHSLTAGTPRETAAYEVKGQITRGANAAATTLVWSAVTVNYEADAAWDVALAADTTNGALDVKVTGNNETAVRWLLDLQFGQVGGTE